MRILDSSAGNRASEAYPRRRIRGAGSLVPPKAAPRDLGISILLVIIQS